MKPYLIESEKPRVLIICDNDANGQFLAEILASDQIDSAYVLGDEDVIELFLSYKPDVVLLDTSGRGEASYQTSRQIRNLNPDIFIPIIFVSASASQDVMSACLEYGGVDCLVKPYDPTVLSLKVQIYRGISQLHKTVRQQRDAMARHSRYLESSYTIAEKVFSKIMQSDVLKSEGIKYILLPSSIFNGDILLAAYRPSGELPVMGCLLRSVQYLSQIYFMA